MSRLLNLGRGQAFLGRSYIGSMREASEDTAIAASSAMAGTCNSRKHLRRCFGLFRFGTFSRGTLNLGIKCTVRVRAWHCLERQSIGFRRIRHL